MRTISQREARRAIARVKELEGYLRAQVYAWDGDWPMGTEVARIRVDPTPYTAIDTARRLKHAVVVTVGPEMYLRFSALPLGGVK